MEIDNAPQSQRRSPVPFHLIPLITLGIWSVDLSSSGVLVDPEWIRPQADIEELPPDVRLPLRDEAKVIA